MTKVRMDERLTAWLEQVGLEDLMLELLEEPGTFEVDYSGRYLAALEGFVFSEVEFMGDPYDLAEPSLERAIAGYFGETLLRLAGGSWRWLEGEPAAQADEVLDLPPVFPLRLIDQLSNGEVEGVFARTYEQWEQAVTSRRQAHPGWQPTKQYTPGLDPVPMTPDEAAYIATWVAERERAFPDWAAEHVADGPWDFSEESLDRLVELLCRLTPTIEDLKDPTHSGFVDGAVWYFGETLRRAQGGSWIYRQHRSGPHDVFAGRPYVRQAGRDSRTAVPIGIFGGIVADGHRTVMRTRYRTWAS